MTSDARSRPGGPATSDASWLVVSVLKALVVLLPTLGDSIAETPDTSAEVGNLIPTMPTAGASLPSAGPGVQLYGEVPDTGGERHRARGGVGNRNAIRAGIAATAFSDWQALSGMNYAASEHAGTERTYRTIRYANGDRYEGEVMGGALHGRGTYTWMDGDRYQGEWRDGRRHGRGTYFWADGNVYEGDWRNGRRHGLGTYTWADGDRLQGRWRDGRRDLPDADCLTVEKTSKEMGLWINRCQVGIDVIWRDEGACRSRATETWPCSWYVAPHGSETAAIQGQVWWRECKSPQGPGGAAAVEKEDGNVYCVERIGPRTSARKIRKRERARLSVQAASVAEGNTATAGLRGRRAPVRRH